MPSNCRRFLISGRVQGVWFRDSTRREAELRSIAGFARNLNDGRVEVVASGDHGKLDELAAWLQQGPRLAKVEHVEELACDVAHEYQDFLVI